MRNGFDKGFYFWITVLNPFDEIRRLSGVKLSNLENAPVAFESTVLGRSVNQRNFAFRIGVEDNSDLIFRNLANMQHALVATSDYLSKSSKLTAPKDLENHSLLTHKLLRSWKLKKKTAPIHTSFLPLSSFESTSFPFLYQLALQGFGITWLPKCYIAEDLIQGKIVEVLTDWEIKDVTMYLAYAKHTRRRYLSKIFINHTTTFFEQTQSF